MQQRDQAAEILIVVCNLESADAGSQSLAALQLKHRH
jgi:hypothetical protein